MNKYIINYVSDRKTIQTKYGEKEKFSIKVDGNDNYLGVWVNGQTANFKVGDEVEGNIVPTAGKDGKMYHNFEVPKKDDVVAQTLINMEGRLRKVERWIIEHSPIPAGTKVSGTNIDYPDYDTTGTPF